MKSSALFLAVTVMAVAIADEDRRNYIKDHEECLSESKADEDLTHAVKEGRFAEDPKLKEYIFCVNKKIGYQNENGEFQTDVIIRMLNSTHSQEVVNKVINTCTRKKSTPQEAAFHSLKCLYEATHINRNKH